MTEPKAFCQCKDSSHQNAVCRVEIDPRRESMCRECATKHPPFRTDTSGGTIAQVQK